MTFINGSNIKRNIKTKQIQKHIHHDLMKVFNDLVILMCKTILYLIKKIIIKA